MNVIHEVPTWHRIHSRSGRSDSFLLIAWKSFARTSRSTIICNQTEATACQAAPEGTNTTSISIEKKWEDEFQIDGGALHEVNVLAKKAASSLRAPVFLRSQITMRG